MSDDELADALKAYGIALKARGDERTMESQLVLDGEARLREMQAEVTRLREALHPGPMPTYANGVTPSVERDSSGSWSWGPFADIHTREWCHDANRYEALTGLDAVTGEKRP